MRRRGTRPRSEAATTDHRDTRALRLHAPACLRMVGRADEMLLAGAHLERQCALARLRHELVRHRSGGRSRPRDRDDRGRRPRARSRRARARRVCADAFRRCRAWARSRASAPARAAVPSAGPTPSRCACRDAISSAPQSASRGSSRSSTRRPTALGIRRRHVLRGVHGDVDAAVEQRLLELLDEDAARADLAERPRTVAVARGRDRDERDLDAGRAQPRGSELGLREGEPTAAGADADQHGTRLRFDLAVATASPATADAHECSRRLHRQRAPDQARGLQRSSSRPKRWRTASA